MEGVFLVFFSLKSWAHVWPGGTLKFGYLEVFCLTLSLSLIGEHVNASGNNCNNIVDIPVRFWLKFFNSCWTTWMEYRSQTEVQMSSYVVWMLRVISVSLLRSEGGSTQIKCLFKKHPWNRPSCLQEDPWHAWHGLSYPKCCQQMLLLSACQSKKATKSHYKLCLTTFYFFLFSFFFINRVAELFIFMAQKYLGMIC